MSPWDLEKVKSALAEAGVEIYRMHEREIHVAERVRLHIMDSGVRVRLDNNPSCAFVTFTARSQQSDFPSQRGPDLLERVRAAINERANERGYEESKAHSTQVRDPMDDKRVLDVWHEITYQKGVHSLEDLIHEVKWALDIDKYVST